MTDIETHLERLPEELPVQVHTMYTDVRATRGQQKVATYRDFEILCDEPEYLGGDDEYPQPLTYVAAGVGFCLLTQVMRFAEMSKVEITSLKCRTEFDIWRRGSVRRGTVMAGVSEFRTHFVVESPESDEVIANIIRLAKRGCFAEQLVQTPVPLKSTYSVNGRESHIDLDDAESD